MRYKEFVVEKIQSDILDTISPVDINMLLDLLKTNPNALKADTNSAGMDLMKLLGANSEDEIVSQLDNKDNDKSSKISKSSSTPANAQAIKRYLESKGLDSNQVAGILANIKHESNFNPAAIGDGGTSGGLFQHHAERFQKMVAACGRDWKRNWKGQIDFALSERAGQQYASLKFTSPEQATKWWTINFEIPANKYAQANIRSQSASQFA